MEPGSKLHSAEDSCGGSDDRFLILDDLAPPSSQRSLTTHDLKLLRALQAILEARQADAWIDDMRAQISTELEWEDWTSA
jgi:hypothetical protein